MKTTRNLLRVALLSSLLAAPLAQAQDTGVYVGAAVGQSSYREICRDFDSIAGAAGAFNCETREATGGKLFAGWRFHRNLAVELSYFDFGKARTTGTVSGAEAEGKMTTKAAGLSAVGLLPVTDNLWIFGRLGGLQTQTTSTLNGNGLASRDETEIHTGIGGMYQLSRHWAARLEYERSSDVKIDFISLGAQYRF
jgi:OOP family OmpA-OmpF porin